MLDFRGKKQKDLFKLARQVRKDAKVELTIRGVIEISSYCRRQCKYCPMSCKNKSFSRFRLSSKQILKTAKKIRKEKIDVLFLQSGEDPFVVNLLKPILPKIKKLGFKQIIGNLGDLPTKDYLLLKRLGLDGYIMKFETSNPRLHRETRGYELSERMKYLKALFSVGFNVGTGSLLGLKNQTRGDMANDILLVSKLAPQMASVSPFIPAKDTPYANEPVGSIDYALNTIAILRIINPEMSIPSVSAFEKLRKGGQLEGFMAGANTLTVNFTPKKEQEKYAIYGKERHVVELGYARNLVEDLKNDF